jgi:DNA-binding Lrp family transcriptional regulator
MRRSKLDKIDKKILRDLQDNGRITNVELADRAGISAPPCLRRVRALEKNGFIKSYHAKLSPQSLGYTVTVFAMVKLSSQAKEDLRAFEDTVTGIPEVRECHLLAGEVDYILRIVAKDWDKYQELHTNHLTNAPHVVSVKSSLAIRSGKDEPGVPVYVE